MVFASIPRTGSSSVKNILSRVAIKHDLVTSLPHDPYMSKGDIRDDKEMNVHPMSMALGVDLFTAQSATWHDATALQEMVPGARLITVLREPMQLFASLYMHTGLEFSMHMDLDEFADDYAEAGVKRSSRATVGQNNLLWGLGVAHNETTDQILVKKKILEIEEKFELVMITERFDESLVLLADVLCWPLEDVRYIKQHQRIDQVIEKPTNETKKILATWLKEDYKVSYGLSE